MRQRFMTLELANHLFRHENGVLYWKNRFNNLARVTIGSEAGTICKVHGYCFIKVKQQRFKRADLVYLMVNGEWPSNMLDHKNRVRSDDRPSNLRVSDDHENALNRSTRTDNTSGVTGVSYDKKGRDWVVRVTTSKGNRVVVGRFKTKDDAIAHRKLF